ncbi:oligosaccharide flippase family protein [Deinococcus apachensis]|uniref:oligosaccharide flippase family protein n=1 Tax=Deinococcus apachensis TaxID=309886 RepID=UPI000360C009|nr:oligosaccharide flippase family protein [Deinococcus apachensis]
MTAATVGRAAMQGAAALLVRQVVIQGLNVLTGVLLARWLVPAEFGVYSLMAFVLVFLIAVGDVGLGASLIRQPEEPDLHTYRVVFTFQQISAGVLSTALWLAAPFLTRYVHLEPAYVWLFRAVGVSLFLTSFQTIAAIRLERELHFQKLAVAEVLQALVYNGVLIYGTAAGWGAWTFALALTLRSLIGAMYLNLRHPWPIGWRWDPALLQPHLAFGLPYQGVSLVSLVKDSITPLLVGGLLGMQAVGYINWAQTVAAYPVMALMFLQRLYLPVFARLQGDPAALRRAVERVLLLTNGVTAILATLTLALAVPLTTLVFGSKWLSALSLLELLWCGNLFVATATPLLALLNALGRSHVTFRFALVWLLATWGLGVPLILQFGTLGFALATAGVQLTNLALFRVAWQTLPFSFSRSVLPPWLIAAPLALTAGMLGRDTQSPGALAAWFAVPLLLYVVVAVLLWPDARRWLKGRLPLPRSIL